MPDQLLSENDLLKKICSNINLPDLLDVFCLELQKISEIQGYMLFLLDETKEKLIVEKVFFDEKFKSMEKVLFKSTYMLNESSIYKKIMTENADLMVFQSNIEEQSDELKRTFELWEVHELAYLSLQDHSIKNEISNPIGILMLLNHEKSISAYSIQSVQNLMSLFYHQIQNSMHFTHLKERESEIQKDYNRNLKIIEIIDQINNIMKIEAIYQTLLKEILSLFNFDFGMLFIEKGEMVEFVDTRVGNPKYSELVPQISRYWFKQKGYGIQIPDGATTISHNRNTYFYFTDVRTVLHLPMSPKDKGLLELLPSPATFLLMPIRRNGKPVGSIHLYTLEQVKPLSEMDIMVIELICSFAGTALANAEIYSLVESQKKKLEEKSKIIQRKNGQLIEELKLAQQIQQNLIPLEAPTIKGISIASLYKPMENVGGDFFDFIQISEPNLLGIFISDVSGHGVPAALITSMIKTLLETSGKNKLSPKLLLEYMNEKISGQTNGNFLTAFYGVLDVDTKQFKYSRASHHFPYLIHAGKLSEITSKGKMLGITKDVYLEEKEISLQKGDKLFFYTDGLTDAINHEAVDFGSKLPDLLLINQHKSVKDFIQSLFHELIQHREEYNFDDDVCMIALEIQ